MTSVDDTLSTTAGTAVMGRRKRQRGKKVHQPNVEENPLPLIPVTTAERIEGQSGEPNGIIPIPAPILTLIPGNIPDAEPVLFESAPPQGVPNEQILDANQSTTKISDDHYKWFTSVHNCWMGHRGVRATLDLLQQRNYIWDTMNSDVPNSFYNA
jgi:hypothetical protein